MQLAKKQISEKAAATVAVSNKAAATVVISKKSFSTVAISKAATATVTISNKNRWHINIQHQRALAQSRPALQNETCLEINKRGYCYNRHMDANASLRTKSVRSRISWSFLEPVITAGAWAGALSAFLARRFFSGRSCMEHSSDKRLPHSLIPLCNSGLIIVSGERCFVSSLLNFLFSCLNDYMY